MSKHVYNITADTPAELLSKVSDLISGVLFSQYRVYLDTSKKCAIIDSNLELTPKNSEDATKKSSEEKTGKKKGR